MIIFYEHVVRSVRFVRRYANQGLLRDDDYAIRGHFVLNGVSARVLNRDYFNYRLVVDVRYRVLILFYARRSATDRFVVNCDDEFYYVRYLSRKDSPSSLCYVVDLILMYGFNGVLYNFPFDLYVERRGSFKDGNTSVMEG